MSQGPPSVTGLSPASGSSAGGTSVTITGTNFTGAGSVTFGTAPATSFTVNSATSITATAPAGSGTVDVTVTTPSGTSATSSVDQYTYTGSGGAPSVSGLSPISGTSAGGSTVTISGANLSGATSVKFGSVAATGYTVNSASQITATAPAGTTTVDVTVTTPSGTSPSSAADEYTYTFSNNGYAISLSASSTAPAVGASVVLTATANQDVGPTPYGFSIFDATTGTELIHAGSGTTLSTTVSQSVATTHRYVAEICNSGGANAQADSAPAVVVWGGSSAPTVTGISPTSGSTSGSTSGGTSVTVSGSNFTGATAVKFGTVAATSFTVNSASSITATSPAGSGTLDVTVTTPSGTSPTGSADQFTYTSAPSVSGISPASGSTSGGTSVSISGSNFTGATAVKFGTVAAASFTVNSASSITATSPAGSATVDITVTTPSGTSPTGSADQFTYTSGSAVPSVSGVAPISGTSSGGSSVTISGANFTGASAVKFGSVAAPSFSVNSSSQITATSPAGTTTVDVTVTTPSGTSPSSAADEYTNTFSNNGYGATISASATTPAVGASVVLTATSNQDVGPTPYGMSIFDATTGTELVHISSGTTASASVSQSAAATHRYVAEICNSGGANAQAVSTPVVVTWGGSAAPAVTGVSPAMGSAVGGGSITISGANFGGATLVRFGSVAASFTANSATSITATSPAGSGAVDVTVTTPGGTSATGASDVFLYTQATTYTYDRADRLSSSSTYGVTTTYTWDGAGNRTGAGSSVFTYDARNELLAGTSAAGRTAYSYTARGTLAMSAGPSVTTTFTADAFDRLANAGSTTYAYDGLDRMVTRSGTSISYAGASKEPVADGMATYARDPFGNPLALQQGSTKLDLVTDRHGDVVGTFSPGSSTLVDSISYDPFGSPFATAGSTHPALGFQGSWSDPATGMVNAEARWYSPATGAFASQDSYQPPLDSVGAADLYTYGNANPLAWADPTGHEADPGTLVAGGTTIVTVGVVCPECLVAAGLVVAGAAAIGGAIAGGIWVGHHVLGVGQSDDASAQEFFNEPATDLSGLNAYVASLSQTGAVSGASSATSAASAAAASAAVGSGAGAGTQSHTKSTAHHTGKTLAQPHAATRPAVVPVGPGADAKMITPMSLQAPTVAMTITVNNIPTSGQQVGGTFLPTPATGPETCGGLSAAASCGTTTSIPIPQGPTAACGGAGGMGGCIPSNPADTLRSLEGLFGPTSFPVAREAGGVGVVTAADESSNSPVGEVLREGRIRVVINSRDHGPPHAHVLGGGSETRIGQNGKPLAGDPELTGQQKDVVEKNLDVIRDAIRDYMKWYRENQK